MTDRQPPASETIVQLHPSGGLQVWGLAIAGAVAMFLVQPPADLWMLAWLAPLPWLGLVQAPRLEGRHPWRVLWIAGFFHWLLAIHWLRLPHPATSIGWVALSGYLACYVPLFIVSARQLVHSWRWPLVLAAPVAWMGCEQLRGWVLGGFTFAGLGHTQWRWTTLIQCADAFGAVGVGGVVMAVAAGLTTAVRGLSADRHGPARVRRAIVGAAVAAGVPLIAVGYGSWRVAGEPQAVGRPLDVLLVQGSIDTELKHDPDAAEQVARHYDELTLNALREDSDQKPDLIVWPETMWRWGLLEIDPEEKLQDAVVEATLGVADGESRESAAERQSRCRLALERQRLDAVAAFARRYGTCWLVGLDRQVITPRAAAGVRNYNAALFLDGEGKPLACYDKMYPVLFGEYIPCGERFPWLYGLTPLPAGLTAGERPLAVTVRGRRVAPTICYETALPEAVRSLVLELERRGERPDVIVNLTNDGWFWGSSELDMHLAGGIFRAVEVRTPLVIAANTGFSAWIDGAGRLQARGPRRATAALRAAVVPDGRRTPWLLWGTLPTGLCVAIVAGAAIASLAVRSDGDRRSGDALTGQPMQV